jgi:hypothetical protein
MLVAYGPDGQSVIAEETSLAQLLTWSHARALYCPNCRANVHVRGGPEKRTQLHFAHQRGECAWSTETESVRHARGKMVLARWLISQFPRADVALEQRLPGPNRIADIFVMHPDGRCWAVEFQCAPLNIEEWCQRHGGYRSASILDIWIVGSNRREKQEAFIEAILAATGEILFLDPLTTPARIWLRWPVSRAGVQSWQQGSAQMPVLEGRVGRLGYMASLSGELQQVRLGEGGNHVHAARSALALRSQLLLNMSGAASVDEGILLTYLRQHMSEEAVHRVILPLLRAYRRDPALLRRYNYGRGHVSLEDGQRILKARQWLAQVARQGFSLPELARELPFVGPYAAFVTYIEMLIALA